MKNYTPLALTGSANQKIQLDTDSIRPYTKQIISIMGGTTGSYDIYARVHNGTTLDGSASPADDRFSKVENGNIDLTTTQRTFILQGVPLTHLMFVPIASPSAASVEIKSMLE
jgi:hypothetical protein